MAGMIFFFFFRTHFTAASPFVLWVSLYTLFLGMILFYFISEPILLLLHHLFCGFLFTLCFFGLRHIISPAFVLAEKLGDLFWISWFYFFCSGHVYHAIFWFCFYIYSPLVYICNAGFFALRGFVGIHQIHVQSSSTASGFQLVSLFLKLRNVQKVLMTIFFFFQNPFYCCLGIFAS